MALERLSSGTSAGNRFLRGGSGRQDSDVREDLLVRARECLTIRGRYLAYDDTGQLRLFPLEKEWTRVGRSLTADVRFDDPTVSRRHALIVRRPDGARVIDDRSLNGVFVNGQRVDSQALTDGDEILVGRYRMLFLELATGAPTRFGAAFNEGSGA